MSVTVATAGPDTPPVRRKPSRFARWAPGNGRFGDLVLRIIAGLVMLYIFLPIFVIVLMSFNKPSGKFNYA
jgi:spermidine/putrescine transport system permease protein